MAVQIIDIRLPKGNDERLTISLSNAKNEPITMKEADDMFFTVKDGFNENIAFQKSLGAGEIKNKGNGKYSIRIKAVDTDELCDRKYIYDIKCVFAAESKIRKTVLKGDIILCDTVTRIKDEEE